MTIRTKKNGYGSLMLLPLGLVVGLLMSTLAQASPVTITAAFGEYTGAVGNGLAFGGTVDFQTTINGNRVAPTEPIPGLESFFTPGDPTLDPSDPLFLGQGIGRTTVPLGTDTVTFSTSQFDPDLGFFIQDPENLLQFTPGPVVDVGVGDEFLLGTFTLANGVFWAADPIHRFTFSITTDSADPLLDGHVFSDTVELSITPNGGVTPENNADLFYLASRRDLGTMAVYELQDSPTGTNTGSIELFGRIGSLIPTRFANPTGGVILGPPGGFPLPPPPSSVPEPSTWLLLASGMAWLFVRRRERRRACSITPLFVRRDRRHN